MSYLLGLARADGYQRGIKRLPQYPRQASEQGKSSCCRSGLCCWRQPCELNKEDLARLATHFGRTPQETFAAHLVVDGDEFSGYLLRMRRTHQDGGEYLSDEETFSLETPCAQLHQPDPAGDATCLVHAAKPIAGSSWDCTMPPNENEQPRWTRAELVELGWDGLAGDE